MASGPHAAQNGCECGPTQNHKFTQNITRFFFVVMCLSVFNVWPKRTLLPVWPRDAKRLDTPALENVRYTKENQKMGTLFQCGPDF